ncbi:hypothetical protein M378DRAFT_26402 [Amanita muscaria Koide BX008]|uniref:Uncharacterized protein n=1 Tax=Amanita muscaria (strain Koide BX008) TaxID=946122 RepID=A0A0C2T2K0_AMAMK|nr:hypothetical protein M378DRAFT_26402 [Amanita muscaria Koide BX008]
MGSSTITIPLHGEAKSSATLLLSTTEPRNTSTPESDLLRKIRLALRGSDTDHVSSVQSTVFLNSEGEEEEELTWNEHTVVISSGGVMRKKWNFQDEGQSIQWACIGLLEQAVFRPSLQAHNAARYSESNSETGADWPTFGLFAQIRNETKPKSTSTRPIPAVFVFLRSIGRIFLRNGFEYTFSLPFIVRKAWPISPHGVMIQRVLEPTELHEAEITGDPVLPTIFSMTSPFAEAAAVGITSGVVGGFDDKPATLKDEDENCTKPLKPIAPTEMLVWTSHRGPYAADDIMVTVDVEQRRLSIWRYVYMKPKDACLPLVRPNVQTMHRKRQSLASNSTHRVSGNFNDIIFERRHNLSPGIRSREQSPVPEFRDRTKVGSLPGMPTSLSTAATMASLMAGGGPSQPQWPVNGKNGKARRNSSARNDVDRMVLSGRIDSDVYPPAEYGRMKASCWVQLLYSHELAENDAKSWRDISVALFDSRWDGTSDRTLMGLCLPKSQSLLIFTLAYDGDGMLRAQPFGQWPAISVAALRATRPKVWDLVIVKPDGGLALLIHGVHELPIRVKEVKGRPTESIVGHHGRIVSVQATSASSLVLSYEDGYKARTTLDLIPHDFLTQSCLQTLAMTLPADYSFHLHRTFLEHWWLHGLSSSGRVQFACFTNALYQMLELKVKPATVPNDSWQKLGYSRSHNRYRDDPALQQLVLPNSCPAPRPIPTISKPHPLLSVVLYALHILAENFRLLMHHYNLVVRLAPVVCRIALDVRPEWGDYWKRLVPDITDTWPSSATAVIGHLDDRIPLWPPDLSAILFGRINSPDWHFPWPEVDDLTKRLNIIPSFAFGRADPIPAMHDLKDIYSTLGDDKASTTLSRSEQAITRLVKSKVGTDILDKIPFGMAAPIREAARTCQLSPPANWPMESYQTIGRNDLAASASEFPEALYNESYRPIKDFVNPARRRPTFGRIVTDTKAAANGKVDVVSGTELDLKDFTDIRFGQDCRLEEVARMLCSSAIPTIKNIERPELSEHDQAKEYQNQVVRFAERTLALPYGRALFTFGCLPNITKEAYAIPKLEFSIRVQPLNATVTPELGKIPVESLHWGEFHNGVAAGLRISPTATGVESSWIAFNKPSDLTPEHAGFLFALGLTGHLKEMLTWHTFSYLTPKHDLTSIGVLLGLSAANVGTANQHVTKLLAVHTPALLPTPTVDLNVSLVTQAAGLSGVGLLYMGTKNRRMAEVCLNQISRKDLVQPDLSNEHREAYTYSAALAFGMIMLGKGTTIPADVALLSRLSVLIHGEAKSFLPSKFRPSFDLNLTSPAATIAVGLMYLKTSRKDIADIVTIPDTVVALNGIQPSFLLARTIARALIMWDSIAPTSNWIMTQMPESIRDARNKTEKSSDDALELAHYNICAGCCFAIGLKYAGTARQEAYMVIIKYFDAFTRLVHSNSVAFDHKIKRSAIRDGLNLISIALSLIMAGTGEITCFRRLRYAYGMYQQTMYHHSLKYGIHMATHLSLGLLFLGGGRYTLGTSNAAIACMVTAFFPRFPHISFDNKCYLQALRHLWVLAVEPRCLIARDVDTTEIVYLPIKITMKEGNEVGTTQLISPTLIPDLNKLISIRVDTPRYWPFYLDTENLPRHKEMLLRNQTLYVKRRTAFLSYVEDPKGSRSLFVRSGSSAGDAATLDFPQVTATRVHPAGDLSEFITSFSNDVLFLAFADRFARDEGETEEECLFEKYCHASLLDSILQDKPQTLQSHLTLFFYRRMTCSPIAGRTHKYYHLRLQDLRFATDFYNMVYERQFSGRTENNPRPPLIRDTTLLGALHALDVKLEDVRRQPKFVMALTKYARGELAETRQEDGSDVSNELSWYLLRNGVPVSTALVLLRQLAQDAYAQCLGRAEPEGTNDAANLDAGIKEVLHSAGTKLSTTFASGWLSRSLDEIIDSWKLHTP